MERAALLGIATGARATVGVGALALRGRLGKAARFVAPPLMLVELVGDKLPQTPSRSEPAGAISRVVAGALGGQVVDGARGARVGAAFALASTYPLERARFTAFGAAGLPDPALAGVEDAAAATLAAVGSAEPPREPLVSDPVAAAAEAGPVTIAEATPPPERPSPLAAAARGLAAALVGTAAMTTAQTSYLKATGGEGSELPGEVARRFVEGVLQRKVPRARRKALNEGSHLAYGASWGIPFGLALGSLRRAPRPRDGVLFGLAVWGVSLAELPALGLAPPPWRQPLADVAVDLGFHLVYGAATGAAYESLTAGQ